MSEPHFGAAELAEAEQVVRQAKGLGLRYTPLHRALLTFAAGYEARGREIERLRTDKAALANANVGIQAELERLREAFNNARAEIKDEEEYARKLRAQIDQLRAQVASLTAEHEAAAAVVRLYDTLPAGLIDTLPDQFTAEMDALAALVGGHEDGGTGR